jgi:hypothetical protein
MSNMATVIRGSIDPNFDFKEYSIAEVEQRCGELEKIYDPLSGNLVQPLNAEAEAFIRHEINRCKVDFLYWATRYAKLKSKDAELIRLNPTAVQKLLIDKIGAAELAVFTEKTGDGILFQVLKARQLGVSTISEMIIAHRVFFYANTTALVAADVDDHTQGLYNMLLRVFDNLPWWMKPRSADPKRDYRVKNKLLSFADQDSIIQIGSSKNLQGGDSGQEKGSMGTGQTLPLVHLSELALWENPWQIDDALMPSIPMSSRTFAIFESTAKGRGNWWHESWEASKKGLGRRRPVFIPWYTDPDTYKLPAPSDWSPSTAALNHADRVKELSTKWLPASVQLTKNQLYWWEITKADYISRGVLHKFLAEYTADDMESFQNSTVGVFPSEMIDDMRQKAGRMPVLVEVRPKMELRNG